MITKLIKQQIGIIFGAVLLIILGVAVGFIYKPFNLADQLCWFDCVWYQSIIHQGYIFDPNHQSNVAFFPLFPFVWKTLGFSFFSIALINVLCFMGMLIYVCRVLSIPLKSTAIFCFSGLLTFFMVPYSESFFFIASSLMLVGFYKKQNSLLFVGICLAIFTRSASLVFMVAFCLMALLSFIKNKTQEGFVFSISILVSALCTAFVFAVHFFYTGSWNGFFIAQSHWEFCLQFPHLPFLQGAWPSSLFDSGALLIGLFSLAILFAYAMEKLFARKNTFFVFTEELRPHHLFSLLYLAGCTLVVVLFLGGSLRSLGRFVFATPFYLIFISLFVSKSIGINWSWKAFLIVGFGCVLVLPSNGYIEHVLQIYANCLALGWLIFYTPPKKEPLYIILVVCLFIWGLAQQSIALLEYLNGNWMG